MEKSSNIYRYNLEILSNLEQNQTIYYEQNKIFVDDRYLSQFRYGNNTIKIIEVINFSFLHYYNQILMAIYRTNEEYNKIINLLRKTNLGIKNIIENPHLINDDKTLYQNLYIKFEKLLEKIEDIENVFYSSSDDESSDEETDSESCLKSMIRTTEEHLRLDDNNVVVNTIYVMKNKFTRILLELGNIIYNIVNF